MRRTRIALLAAVAALMACGAPATVAGAQATTTDYAFTGTCGTNELPLERSGDAGILGSAALDPPFGGATFLDIAYAVRGQGLCKGTLNGEPVSDLPISLHIDGRGDFSCAARRSTSFTRGWITSPTSSDPAEDIILPLTGFGFHSFATGVLFSGEGPAGGRFTGRAQFVTEPQSEDIGLRCLGIGGPGNDTGIEKLAFLGFAEIPPQAPLHGAPRGSSDDGQIASPAPEAGGSAAGARALVPARLAIRRALRDGRRLAVSALVDRRLAGERVELLLGDGRRLLARARLRVDRRGRVGASGMLPASMFRARSLLVAVRTASTRGLARATQIARTGPRSRRLVATSGRWTEGHLTVSGRAHPTLAAEVVLSVRYLDQAGRPRGARAIARRLRDHWLARVPLPASARAGVVTIATRGDGRHHGQGISAGFAS